MRCSLNIVLPVIIAAASLTLRAQMPTYHIGRTPTEEEISAWDISISPEGKGLPHGSGTAKEGAKVYAQHCAQCHGPTATEAKFLHGRLVGGKGTLNSYNPVRTIGSYWPYAPPLFDYIRRAMPRNAEGSLSVDELYAVIAFLLYRNDLIREDDVIDSETLPKVSMPNRNGFVPPHPEWKPPSVRNPQTH